MTIAPRYRVIALDETNMWAPEIVAITGRIAGVYVVNFAERVHLCSMTGSHYAEFVCNITENEVREPDGYHGGRPVWDDQWAEDCPEAFARSKALLEAWRGPYHGIAYENAGEPGSYFDHLKEPDGSLIELTDWDEDPTKMSPDDAEEYRRQRDAAAMEAVQEYMANGEEWADIAPWKKSVQ